MSLILTEYNRNDTVLYAKEWAMNRNPKYYNYDKLGGDCTNFASQCLFAGAKVMNYKPNFGWYYTNANMKSPSWTGIDFFYKFLINNTLVGPSAILCNIDELEIGDFIQLGNSDKFYHTLVIVRIDGVPSEDTIYIAAHTFDSYDRPLSSYFYEKARYLHINMVKKWK